MSKAWGVAAAALCGVVWGATWMAVIGTTFSFFGNVARPPVGTAALAGLLAAVAILLWPARARTPAVAIGAFVLMLAVLVAGTGGRVLGLEPSVAPLGQALAAALVLGLSVWSLWLCIGGFGLHKVTRHALELVGVRLLKGLGLVLFSVFVALPFYVMLMTSFKSQQSLLTDPLDYSLDLGQGASGLFRSYIELFENFNFGTFMLNSAIVSVATVVCTLLIAVPGAYAVARLRFPGQAFLSQSILLIYMIPAIVLVIPLYAVFSQAGLRNSLTGLLIVYTATTIPVALYMLQGYFRGLPTELEEAGLMDGLRRMGVIARITLPLSLPALASVALYVFMIAWNEFLFSFMFLDDVNIFTLSRGVVSLNSSEVPRQHLMAGAVVATVPVLVVFLACERFLVSGLTAGSVKG